MNSKNSILILDNEKDRREQMFSSLEDRCGTVPRLFIYVHAGDQSGWSPSVPSDLEGAILFVHWSDSSMLTEKVVADVLRTARVKIAYSGGGLSAREKLPDGWFRIPRSFTSTKCLSEDEWRELCQWGFDHVQATDEIPRALRETFPATLIALDILCQGYFFAHGVVAGDTERSEGFMSPRVDQEWQITTRTIDWWLAGLAVKSLEELFDKLISQKVSRANASEVVKQLKRDRSAVLNKYHPIPMLHSVLTSLIR